MLNFNFSVWQNKITNWKNSGFIVFNSKQLDAFSISKWLVKLLKYNSSAAQIPCKVSLSEAVSYKRGYLDWASHEVITNQMVFEKSKGNNRQPQKTTSQFLLGSTASVSGYFVIKRKIIFSKSHI